MYDTIILGGGPAGLTAGIYCSRYNLDTLILTEGIGGTITDTHLMENWPTEKQISGDLFAKKVSEHAKEEGTKIEQKRVSKIKKEENQFKITTFDDEEYTAKSILLAFGSERKKLGLEKEEEFLGKGLSYCATCDGMFFKDKTVAVVGGGNAGVNSALYLSKVAKKVYLYTHGEALRASSSWIEKIKDKENIDISYFTEIKDLLGDEKLEKIIINKDGKEEKVKVDGLFIEIGSSPSPLPEHNFELEKDSNNFIKVDQSQQTSQDMVWAAGDITDNSNKFFQAITAASEGAVAAQNIAKTLIKRIH